MTVQSIYRCEEKIVQHLEDLKLPLQALRLAHACLYLMESTREGTIHQYTLPRRAQMPAFVATCAELLRIMGTAKAKDLRALRDGIEQLRATGIFDILSLNETGRKLSFKPGYTLAQCATRLKNKPFALVDLEKIRRLRSAQHIYLYVRAEMVQRSDFPLFELPHIRTDAGNWETQKRNWRSAALAVHKALGVDLLLVPEQDVFRDKVIRVKVKLSTQTSKWSPQKLYSGETTVSAIVITGGLASMLSGADYRSRRNWTCVGGPHKGALSMPFNTTGSRAKFLQMEPPAATS